MWALTDVSRVNDIDDCVGVRIVAPVFHTPHHHFCQQQHPRVSSMHTDPHPHVSSIHSSTMQTSRICTHASPSCLVAHAHTDADTDAKRWVPREVPSTAPLSLLHPLLPLTLHALLTGLEHVWQALGASSNSALRAPKLSPTHTHSPLNHGATRRTH